MLLDPLSDEWWPPSAEGLRSGFAGGLNVYRVMAHHPDLLTAWESLREHVVRRTELGPHSAEIVVLRVARHWRCEYERRHHVARAEAVGMDRERIAALGGPLEGVDEADRPVAAAVDDLLAQGGLDHDRAHALLVAVGPKGALDLIATIGMYTTLALLANTFEVPIDAPA